MCVYGRGGVYKHRERMYVYEWGGVCVHREWEDVCVRKVCSWEREDVCQRGGCVCTGRGTMCMCIWNMGGVCVHEKGRLLG